MWTLIFIVVAVAMAVAVPSLKVVVAPDVEIADMPPGDTVNAVDVEKKAAIWADSVMSGLSLRQRIAQLFVPRLDITDNAAGLSQLRKMVANEGIGGILLGKGSLKSYAAVFNAAQSYAEVPVLVTLDGEWGLAMRVSDAPRFPYNMTLGAIQDEKLLYEYGRELGRECKAIGIQVDFAPVLDVNSNPENPVIGYRSFGEDPERVSILGASFCAGMESQGVMSVGKHFPGHGDTSVDSHKALPTVSHSKVDLTDVDMRPFRDAAKAGMSGIMVGHLRVPALDKSGTPASLSHAITTELLRDELNFDGLVFTDALAMKGAVVKCDNNCVSALLAGADVLLGSGSPVNDIDAVERAVNSGRIKRSVIDGRCRKVLEWKYRLGLGQRPEVDVASISSKIHTADVDALIDRLSKAAVTVLNDRTGLLPLSDLAHRRISVVNIGGRDNDEFSTMCSRYADVDVYSVGSSGISESEIDEILSADIVVAGVFSDAVWAVSAFNRLSSADNFVPVFFLNPYKMAKFPRLDAQSVLIAAYEGLPAMQRAAAQAIFGGIHVSGRFPVNVEGVAPLGAGLDLRQSRLGFSMPSEQGADNRLRFVLDSIAGECITAGAFPGCQVVVVKNGDVIVDGAYGALDYDKAAPSVTSNTLYDIASMSKAVATVSGVMKAFDEGLFLLDDTVGYLCPHLEGTSAASLTMRELLFHETGMRATLDTYRLFTDTASYSGRLLSARRVEPFTRKITDGLYVNKTARIREDVLASDATEWFDIPIAENLFGCDTVRDLVMDAVYSLPLGSKRYLYSCLNFCVLMDVEESLTGVSHDQWVDTEVFSPIGAWHTLYRPLERFGLDEIAPTEVDNYLRRQHIHGYVHDELAAFSGGVQGNAGLFSTAGDVAKLCQTWLNGGIYGKDSVFTPECVDKFTRTISANNRGLGFDMLSRNTSLSASGASDATYGHTGFTGTCFWVDPENNLIFVFLSNRVNPSRNNPAFTRLNPRQRMLQAVYDSFR